MKGLSQRKAQLPKIRGDLRGGGAFDGLNLNNQSHESHKSTATESGKRLIFSPTHAMNFKPRPARHAEQAEMRPNNGVLDGDRGSVLQQHLIVWLHVVSLKMATALSACK